MDGVENGVEISIPHQSLGPVCCRFNGKPEHSCEARNVWDGNLASTPSNSQLPTPIRLFPLPSCCRLRCRAGHINSRPQSAIGDHLPSRRQAGIGAKGRHDLTRSIFAALRHFEREMHLQRSICTVRYLPATIPLGEYLPMTTAAAGCCRKRQFRRKGNIPRPDSSTPFQCFSPKWPTNEGHS